VDAWTSYQEDSLANLSVKQVLEERLKTLGISSPTSSKESESADPQLSFLKMSKESSQAKQKTENPFSNMSSEAWKKWVTQQRQEYSQRQKLAHHIRESESLSWATPQVMDHINVVRKPEERSEAANKGGCKNLREEVINWPTARTSDAEGGPIETELSDQGFRSKRHKSDQWFGAKLRDAVETLENWPTPRATKMEGSTNKDYGNCLLETVKENWPTPTAHFDSMYVDNSPNKDKRHSNGLATQVDQLQKDRKGSTKQWATPTSRDWKGSYKPESLIRKDGRSRLDALPQMAEYDPTSGLQDPTNHNTTGKNH
tara:strand:- start:602 stop:1543 length:942 start_codon:yes stop_codon:yes gene_type:complete